MYFTGNASSSIVVSLALILFSNILINKNKQLYFSLLAWTLRK